MLTLQPTISNTKEQLMFRTGLTSVMQGDNPNFWANYAIGVAIRALYHNDRSLLEFWGQWAGGRLEIYTGISGHLSAMAVFTDGAEAIILHQGTVSGGQLWLEATCSAMNRRPGLTGGAHAFFLYVFTQRLLEFQDRILELPHGFPFTIAGDSLGGAVAQITANYLTTVGHASVRGLLTFGQPAAGNRQFNQCYTGPYVRWENEGDWVVTLPPPIPFNNYLIVDGRLVNQWDIYARSGQQWNLLRNGGFNRGALPLPPRPSLPFSDWIELLITPGSFDDAIRQDHGMREYLRRLRFLIERQTDRPDLTPIHTLNGQLDQRDQGLPLLTLPMLALPVSAGTFANPNVVIPPDGSLPTVPAADVGRTVEVRFATSQLFHFGGNESVAHAFRGRDRRLLTTLKKVITSIQARDARVANPKKTRTLSNRIVMFPNTGEPSLQSSLEFVLAQAQTLLDDTA